MAHPTRFSPGDELLARLREICSVLPGADEKISHGRPAFFTKKIFAIYGAVTKGEHHAGDHDHALVFMPATDELPAIDGDDRFFVPAYWGPSGWRGIDLDRPDTDWEEIGELVEDSFRETATKKLIAEFEAGSAGGDP